MHYAYDVVVLPENTADNNVEVSVKLCAGIIKHVSLIFPPGCARLVKCTLWNPAEQLLPSNPEASYGEDCYTVEADCYIPTEQYGNQFYILAWTLGTSYRHTIRVLIDVQGVDEPDFAIATETLYRTVESLVSLIKGFY